MKRDTDGQNQNAESCHYIIIITYVKMRHTKIGGKGTISRVQQPGPGLLIWRQT